MNECEKGPCMWWDNGTGACALDQCLFECAQDDPEDREYEEYKDKHERGI